MSGERLEIEHGDAIYPGKPVTVDRYRAGARVNHWITAACLILLALSGLAMFHPSLFFLSGLFGGGQNTRALHPILGVILFFSFLLLFLQFWRLNLWTAADSAWIGHVRDLLGGHEERMPEAGRYNAGQKVIFWAMTVLILTLIGSGILIWDQYFSDIGSIEVKRFALLIHSGAAIAMICVWIVHAYAAFWIRGTLEGMIHGRVTGGWAWRHHRKWLRHLAGRPANKSTPAA